MEKVLKEARDWERLPNLWKNKNKNYRGLLVETMQAEREWTEILKELEEKNHQPRILIQ